MPSVWRRGVAALVGLWFGLWVSGIALQLCPQHGAMMMAAMHQAGTHCAPSHGHSMPQGSHKPDDSHDDCTCSGMCCVTATVTLTAARLVLIPVVEAETPTVVAARTGELAPRAAPDFTLPPPLGPPTLRA